MSFNKSHLAFKDVQEIFARALESPKGVRIPCNSRGEAIALRSRFNYWRSVDRKDNAKIYEPEHPMHRQSAYDALVLRVPPKGVNDENILYIEHRSASNFIVEEIT